MTDTDTQKVAVDLGKAEAALSGPLADAIELNVRALRAARAEKKEADDAAKAQGLATFALMKAGLPATEKGSWTIEVDLPRVGTRVVATAFESHPREVDLALLATLVPESVMQAVTVRKIGLEQFDAAVKLGLITAEQVAAVVSTTETQMVKLTESAIK